MAPTAAGQYPDEYEVIDIENTKTRITEKSIGGTVYIIEAFQSPDAKETAYAKVKRLILSNSGSAEKLSKSTQINQKINSTCA